MLIGGNFLFMIGILLHLIFIVKIENNRFEKFKMDPQRIHFQITIKYQLYFFFQGNYYQDFMSLEKMKAFETSRQKPFLTLFLI